MLVRISRIYLFWYYTNPDRQQLRRYHSMLQDKWWFAREALQGRRCILYTSFRGYTNRCRWGITHRSIQKCCILNLDGLILQYHEPGQESWPRWRAPTSLRQAWGKVRGCWVTSWDGLGDIENLLCVVPFITSVLNTTPKKVGFGDVWIRHTAIPIQYILRILNLQQYALL